MIRPASSVRAPFRALAALLVAVALAGCQYLDPPALYRLAAVPDTPVGLARAPHVEPVRFTVLTYNVEGLSWPARKGRADRLRIIGRQLAMLREEGRAPDIVLLQEVFSRAAIDAVRASGYANAFPGPARSQRGGERAADLPPPPEGGRSLLRGERMGRRAHSGLYILTDWPILRADGEPFSRRACAGFDCMANKGMTMARIAVPGTPVALEVFNTHLNSRGRSRARPERADAAHAVQLHELDAYIRARRDARLPMVLGGDFNAGSERARFDLLDSLAPPGLASRDCAMEAGCQVLLSRDGDEPWADTQDLQFFADGASVAIVPVRVEALFDWHVGGERLSDHDGLLVTYELRPILTR